MEEHHIVLRSGREVAARERTWDEVRATMDAYYELVDEMRDGNDGGPEFGRAELAQLERFFWETKVRVLENCVLGDRELCLTASEANELYDKICDLGREEKERKN